MAADGPTQRRRNPASDGIPLLSEHHAVLPRRRVNHNRSHSSTFAGRSPTAMNHKANPTAVAVAHDQMA
jgi:hypothetical protein